MILPLRVDGLEVMAPALQEGRVFYLPAVSVRASTD
jgi:hypothetical protein